MPGNPMTTSDEDLVATLLVSDEPQRQATRLLDLLMRRTKARGALILSARTRPPSLFVSMGADLSSVGELSAAWQRVEAQLTKGEDAVVGEGRAISLLLD